MAILQTMCSSFKEEVLEGVHNFTSHTFKMALYTSSADLGASTTVYTTSNEVTNTSGTAYSAGGVVISVTAGFPKLDGTTAIVDFGNPTWSSATFTTSGALIYNSSASNKAVAVLNFGIEKSVSNSTLEIKFPTADATSAIIRIA